MDQTCVTHTFESRTATTGRRRASFSSSSATSLTQDRQGCVTHSFSSSSATSLHSGPARSMTHVWTKHVSRTRLCHAQRPPGEQRDHRDGGDPRRDSDTEVEAEPKDEDLDTKPVAESHRGALDPGRESDAQNLATIDGHLSACEGGLWDTEAGPTSRTRVPAPARGSSSTRSRASSSTPRRRRRRTREAESPQGGTQPLRGRPQQAANWRAGLAGFCAPSRRTGADLHMGAERAYRTCLFPRAGLASERGAQDLGESLGTSEWRL